MQARINQLPFEPNNGSRLSSSLPSLSRVDQYSAPSNAHDRHFDSGIDESVAGRRTTAARQLHALQAPFQQQHRRTTSAGGHSSLPSQPVVVRTYSAEAAESPSRPSGMGRSSRSYSDKSRQVIQPILPPAVEDFSIEGILRAIEPDIQSTLDSIAEICGRSRLSLANEYGSHRPPLGEIRAPSRPADYGLLTVAEASSSAERLAGENVLVVGDDISTLDGREPTSSTYTLVESLRSNVGVVGHRPPASPPQDESVQPHLQPEPQTATPESRNPVPMPATLPTQHPAGNDTLATSIPLLWGRLGRQSGIDPQADHQNIQTQPVISEVHLDVEAERSHQYQPELDATWPSVHLLKDDDHALNKSLVQVATERLSLLSDLKGWLEWWRGMGHHSEQSQEESFPSAEMTLRDVLERHDMSLGVPDSASHGNAF